MDDHSALRIHLYQVESAQHITAAILITYHRRTDNIQVYYFHRPPLATSIGAVLTEICNRTDQAFGWTPLIVNYRNRFFYGPRETEAQPGIEQAIELTIKQEVQRLHNRTPQGLYAPGCVEERTDSVRQAYSYLA